MVTLFLAVAALDAAHRGFRSLKIDNLYFKGDIEAKMSEEHVFLKSLRSLISLSSPV